MNKKKIMILFLALMTLSITACGQDATADDESMQNQIETDHNENGDVLEPEPIEFQQGEVKQIGYEYYGIDSLHEEGTTGRGVKIAILDTGIDIDNQDLVYEDTINFISDDASDIMDENGHGTKIAGIIAARKDGEGMIGIAPDAELYICKISDSYGTTNNRLLTEGIEWAIEKDVDIINISIEFDKEYNDITQAMQEAADKGIIILASAGNQNTEEKDNEVKFPAKLEDAISVSMLGKDGEIFEYAIQSDEVDVYAPGDDVVATTFDNKLIVSTDNSSAVAYASGVTALLMQQNEKQLDQQMAINLLNDFFGNGKQ